MKTIKRFSFLVLLLWMVVIQSIMTQDTCPSGMRKTYLDETSASEEGAARNYVPALLFHEGNGALWYRRKVLIEPRFEVHLKAEINGIDYIETNAEGTLQGFTIVISKNKNKLSTGTSDYIGYYGFTKSFILEFDFDKTLNDPDDSSYSFRYCDSQCSNDDSAAYISGKLINQRFNPSKDMTWDFRLIYTDKKLMVYSGPNELLFSHNVDLYSVLGSNTAYVGFTGNMNGNRRELNVLGTFICEDNFDISKMSGKFYVDEQELDTYTYKAGETVQYLFSFINNKGQVIPHCFRQGIWTYSFSLSLDCAASNLQIRMKDEYSLFLSMNACNVLGEHTIGISEASHGVGPENKYTIVGGAINNINLIGHDGTVTNIDNFSTSSNGVRTLTYGTVDGDFPLKGSSIEIVLDFELKDSFGNDADAGTTSSDILKNTGLTLTKANSATLTMRQKDSHYQLVITVVKTGSYEITKNAYMSESINFNVIIGGVSAADSYCTIDGYTEAPTLKEGDTAYYNCYFKDGKGNIMDIKTFISTGEYDFSCQTKRTTPSSKTYTNSYNDKGNYYQCPFQITEPGIYQFYGYLTTKDSKKSKTTISPKVNIIYVSSSSFSLGNAKIFNYYTKKWVDIDNAVIEYRNDKGGKLTSLDFADSTGTLISKYKTYPSSFDVSEVKVEFYSDHDYSFNYPKFVAEIYHDNNSPEYIGIYNVDKKASDNIIPRSSYDYTLKITYKSEVKYVTFRFNSNTLKIGSYTTCFHEYSFQKTKESFSVNYNDIEFSMGVEKKLNTLVLKTNDNNLYNYDIGKKNIKVELTNSGTLSYRVVPLSIAGTYEIYATISSQYWGNIKLTVEGNELANYYVYSSESQACYLQYQKPELFEFTSLPEPREHYYDYIGDYVDGNLEFFFFVLDKNYKNLTKDNIFDNNVDIYCLQYGADTRKYTISYNKTAKAYQFRDKLDFANQQYTWVFHMRDGTCNHKYYVKYDQSRIKKTVSLEYSYYNLLKNDININEYGFVDVYLKDGNNAFMGITEGKLNEIKGNVQVTAIDQSTKKSFNLEFAQITSNYAIRFQHAFDTASTYEIIAYYNTHDIPCSGSKILKVTAPEFSLKSSKLQMVLDSTIDMYPNTKYTIQNSLQIPFYNLILYTSGGLKTIYTSANQFSCTMTGQGINMNLKVNKKGDYIQFTYQNEDKDQFSSLKGGDYILTVTADGESQDYQLYLVGDGDNDYSNEKDYDLSQTFVDPTHIDGQVGKTYEIKLEFRAKDGLRWNYRGSLDKFKFTNSYGLSSDKFITKVVEGYKKGQYIISVTQNVVTDKGDNILTILYDSKQIPQTVSLTIKGGDFAKLVLVGGPTDGNVINHPILTFKPVDSFGNLYTFDSSVTKEYLNKLTHGKSLEGVSLTTNNYLENGLLKVQYKTTISTNVQVTSDYLDEPINYRIKSGPISPETSYAEMQTSPDQAAGSNYTIVIYPKDIYLNDIDDLGDKQKDEFLTYYKIVETDEKFTVKDCKLSEGHSSAIDIIIRKLIDDTTNVYDTIECVTPISYIGNIAFHVHYLEDEIECKNCVFSVFASQFDFQNTKTYYKNKEYYLDTKKQNEVEAKKEPIFDITFFDQFKNSITDPEFLEELDIEVIFEGADVKLCVTNSIGKKVATLCPSYNGDDNINKWQYITNGDNYKLIVQEKGVPDNKLEYNITIIGGSDGSSDDPDFSKTKFEPTTIKIQAGDEGKTIMEIRTAKEVRKNYWYPDFNDKIKVEFNADKDTCSYSVDKADLPGQYAIKVTCTKVNENNYFTVTVDGNKIDQKINLIVTSGPAYYLEVEDKDKFTVSGDKYTWKNYISNDDEINFNFKLQDKYKNYILTSVKGTNQITISSDSFGTNENYYNYDFNDQKKDYLFTDKIYMAINKHTWNIVCNESGKKYSFTYTRIPGKVDVDKSYWAIDKTEYIINESSTVLVTLVDKYGVNLGGVSGQLEKEKDNLKVVTHKDKDIEYNYNSVTKDNNIKYLYTYKAIGTYEVSVTYDGKQIGEKKTVTVSYQKIDLKSSKLYYDIGDGVENYMTTTEQTNINNLEVCPFYKLYLYTANGEKITLYDKKISSSCVMTFNDVNTWDLEVSNMDDFIYISHKDCIEFRKLPGGLYHLGLTVDGQYADYPLYLLGEKDVSPYQKYDLSKTYIRPTYIDGVAGERYQIDIEFRCKDGLRWNYEVNLNSFDISNSYKLDSNLIILEKTKGEKDGQIKLFVTQYVATTGGKDNILSFTYEKNSIPQTVTLHIKCAPDLFELVYDSGAVDGTVINPSIVKFIPKDKYGNLYTDITNTTLFPKSKLEQLTNGASDRGYDLTTNNYATDDYFLNVQYGSKKVTKVILTSKYNPNTYEYYLWSGPIDPAQSYAEVEKTDDVKAGDTTKLIIHPKDAYGNDVTNATKDDLDKFDVDYTIDNDYKEDISDKCDASKASTNIDCQTIITKVGDAQFLVDYDDQSVKCINCEFTIGPGKLDFSKTKVINKNENKEMSQTELNTLPVTIPPNFQLNFYDKYKNPITDKKEVEQLNVGTEIVVTDVKLCVSNDELHKLSKLCKSQDNDENEEKWQYVPNGENYKLIVTDKDTKEQLTYPVKLTGGYSDGDPDQIAPEKTSLEPSEITLVAGEEGTVSLELRTENDKRKSYWFAEPEKHISVKFPEEVKNCTYSLARDEKPGQYNIKFKCYKKTDPFKATVTVEGVEVPKPITIKVIPAEPYKSRLFRMTGEEILESYLGSVSVEDSFQMINKLYDKYDNLITNIDFNLAILQIKMAPVNTSKSHTWSADLAAQANGEIIITLKSTYAIEHIVVGKYFQLDQYSIIFTPGAPNADNSLLEVSDTDVWVGQEVKIYITPYDKYNNYIDASAYKDVSPYQVKYSNEKETNKVITVKQSVEVKDGKNVLTYPASFYVKGITTINGYIDANPIHCVVCKINIKAKDIDFLNSNVLRLEPTKNEFEVLKNGTVEKNTKDEPLYRLYPRDEFGNSIDILPEDEIKKYSSYLSAQFEDTVYNLKLNNKETTNQEYAEFAIDDDNNKHKYTDLVGGFYDLIFTDGTKKLAYNITLYGDGKGGSNEPVDIQSTHIVEQNLKYVAGNTGYMIIELRTKNNIRKNQWEGYEFKVESCDPNDKTFDYVQEKAGTKGVFYITVTSQKANTYPTLKECPLKIYLNDELINDLKPEMEVSPDAVVRTKILEDYYKDGKSSDVLKDGTVDNPYVFEVASYDKYGNLAETLQEVVGIKVSKKGGDEVEDTTSETDKSTGYRKYTSQITVSGTYVVSTDKSGPQGLYLPNESIFIVHPGVIDLSKLVVKERATPIKAGSKPAITIEAFDKYGNALYVDNYVNKFTATFIDANNEEHDSTGAFDSLIEKVVYTSTTPVTIVGNVKVTLVYDKTQKVDTSNVIIVVEPGDPDPTKSILTREVTKGSFTQYKNGDSFSVDVNEPLILNVTLYDKYNNFISNIPNKANVDDPLLSGNKMTPISFNVSKYTSYFGLDFNENEKAIHIYQHLVKGTYDLTYDVKYDSDKASFKYYVVVTNGDDKHGNGPYVIEKCVLTPKKTSFVAGNYEEFTLELRTEEGLLYNDDIDIDEDIEIGINKLDPSFSKEVVKAGSDYGIYTITIYSEKKGDYSMDVFLTDPKSTEGEKGNVGPAEYTVYPDKVPCKNYTKIIRQPESIIPADENFEIHFTLADKFNNSFKGRNDIIDNSYLTLLNNEYPISVISMSLDALDDDKEAYKLVIYPKYPPNKMVMNVKYNDGENSVYCFMDDIIVNIQSTIDYYQTQIVSKNKERIYVGELLDMWLYTFDKKGECFDDGKDYSPYFEIKVTGPADSPNLFTKVYQVEKTKKEANGECNNEYKIITTDADIYKYAGDYLIQVYGNNLLIGQNNQVCIPLGYSLFNLEYDFDPEHISVTDMVKFKITGTDKYGNKLTDPLLNDLTIELTDDTNSYNETDLEADKYEIKSGELNYELEIHKAGTYQMHMYYNGTEITVVNGDEPLPKLTVEPGPCRAEDNSHVYIPNSKKYVSVRPFSFSFECYDEYDNKITTGGEEFVVTGKMEYNDVELTSLEIEDNNDGSYTVSFVPDYPSIYYISLSNDGLKYGNDIQLEFVKRTCSGSTPILCANNECATDYLSCIQPPNGCNISAPFLCKVDGVETCVKSQTDCDCPTGYIKCDYMKYCVPEDREDMCPIFLEFKCPKRGAERQADGICRSEGGRPPSQLVCPYGKVLCADLTCKDNYDECPRSDILTKKVRCVDQTQTDSNSLCPSTITCTNPDYVVCPDTKCVENEIMCGPMLECPIDYPYLCSTNICVAESKFCGKRISCSEPYSLCEDHICRENCDA